MTFRGGWAACLVLILAGGGAPVRAEAVAGGQAIARVLGAPQPARFRNVSVHGDVICGEIATRAGFTPFYAYRDKPDWVGHTAADGRGLKAGLQCFDRETRAGGKVEGCKAYDFGFYFAYDHFCR